MLKGEKQARTNAGLMKLPALGLHGLMALADGRRPDWGAAAGEVFRERPFEDVRVAVRSEGVQMVNLSEVARSRDVTVSEVVALMEGRGYEILNWQEFEAKADNLGWAALRGEAEHVGIEEAAIHDMQATTTQPEARGKAPFRRPLVRCCVQDPSSAI